MRNLPALLILSALATALPALAQEGCTQASPCTWYLSVDEGGFDASIENRTVGDWMVVDVSNFGEETHTVALDAFDVRLVLAPDDNLQSAPFQLDAVGAFQVRDQPSGDTVTLNVVACNPDEFEAGTCTADGDTVAPATTAPPTSAGGRTPGFEAAFLVAGLVAALALRRAS